MWLSSHTDTMVIGYFRGVVYTNPDMVRVAFSPLSRTPVPHDLLHLGLVRVNQSEGGDVRPSVLELLEVHTVQVLRAESAMRKHLMHSLSGEGCSVSVIVSICIVERSP
jgi:hypothetical protein